MSIQEEQAAKLKAEKIRVALEKIKEAQVKKVRPVLPFVPLADSVSRMIIAVSIITARCISL